MCTCTLSIASLSVVSFLMRQQFLLSCGLEQLCTHLLEGARWFRHSSHITGQPQEESKVPKKIGKMRRTVNIYTFAS